ncbi:MAG TPA: hypothetical protein IAB45_04895 [Candidatus Onthousia faecavium]|nr:hypothetical protein [Candidatus Onthousia faecavium]
MKIEENTQNTIKFMGNVDNKENLIELYIRGIKKNGGDYHTLRESLKTNFDRLELSKIEKVNIVIFNSLIEAYKSGEDIYKYTLELCEKLDVTPNNLVKVITDFNADDERTDLSYKCTLNEIKFEIENKMILDYKTRKENRNYGIAKATVRYFLSVAKTPEEFSEITSKYNGAYYKALKILKPKDHPLYLRCLELKNAFLKDMANKRTRALIRGSENVRDSIKQRIASMSDQETIAFLKKRNNNHDLALYCNMNGFKTNALIFFLQADETLAEQLTFAEDKKAVYDLYQTYYVNILNEMGEELAKIYRFKLKRPLNAYDYAVRYNLDVKDLAFVGYSLRGVKNLNLIRQYVDSNPQLFEPITPSTVEVLSQTNKLTCGGTAISFEKSDLYKAIDEIKEHSYPFNLGVLYGAIKHQKALKMDESINKILKKD